MYSIHPELVYAMVKERQSALLQAAQHSYRLPFGERKRRRRRARGRP